jgi:hypothetical protein
MKALRRRAAVAPFLVSVNPTYGAGLGRRHPRSRSAGCRPPQEPKHRGRPHDPPVGESTFAVYSAALAGVTREAESRVDKTTREPGLAWR